MMFANPRDSVRRDFYPRMHKVDRCVTRGTRFYVTIPVLGEAHHMLREKLSSEDLRDSLDEIHRLFDVGLLEMRFNNNPQDLFSFAKSISRPSSWDSDRISTMDALIFATAATMPDCDVFITTDSKLISGNGPASEELDDFRMGRGLQPLIVTELDDYIRQ